MEAVIEKRIARAKVRSMSGLRFSKPSCVATFAPIFWEPIAGTGERLVALVAVEPHETSEEWISPVTHCVISQDRLRAMLGRDRASAAYGILTTAARHMTAMQAGGQAVDSLKPPFQGFTVGPPMISRGFAVEQILDAAVRSVSVFGSADELISGEEERVARHSVTTSVFLKNLKRMVIQSDQSFKERFERRLEIRNGPEVVIDYSFKKWFVQFASLPMAAKQESKAQTEAQSKLFELNVVRTVLNGNQMAPVLLVNDAALSEASSAADVTVAERLNDRLSVMARQTKIKVLRAKTPEQAASLVIDEFV